MPFRPSSSSAFRSELEALKFDLDGFVETHRLFEGARERIRLAAEVSAGRDALEFVTQMVKLIRLYGTVEIQIELDEFEQRIGRLHAHPVQVHVRKKVG